MMYFRGFKLIFYFNSNFNFCSIVINFDGRLVLGPPNASVKTLLVQWELIRELFDGLQNIISIDVFEIQ